MGSLSCLTPNGQITIPRPLLKSLGIGAGNQVCINIEKGHLVLRRVEDVTEKGDGNARVQVVSFL